MRRQRELAENVMEPLAVLIPVRNGTEYLPALLDQLRRLADLVVALDDGSTDETRQVLAADSTITHLLTRPVRPTYEGWDDLSNRNALLQKLTSLSYVGWVLFLDADELLDERDARTLREMIASRRLDKGLAYAVRVFRMVHDLDHFYKDPFIAYRLFHFSPGYQIEGGRLHFFPIPREIPTSQWRETAIRVKHRSSLTAELRQKRFMKYVEADPDNKFQPSYRNLVDEPLRVRHWSETDSPSFFPDGG
jgi:hypothetical protein